ncbi:MULTISPECIES: thiosulfate oxidation carrier complex protein SoxZ [unclassified Duganella]|jgi:sulfur-oxidizing protein SoxZ|uniref:thiosulfate oxidation carrier complex protein SoxZ n=1 Tax=unclassified Duganella TaxID=2636909 RepID=UPI0008855A6E|nr:MULTISPECIES: thiosulfate oxidation carrier complex protein SoxZ [unclassified Duganella]SDH49610.1 sulfur-oxidizing protein SoxZ [Duganella sp. OV458]SDK63811.1 sulfur-oxidizing protein SoxZ [Duganella sp. OV510]
MARALIHMPATAKRGEIIEIRALIGHPMETGYRVGADGKLLARDIIRSFACHYNGEQIFGAELHQAISANPYIAFFTIATESGTLEFAWQGDNGFTHTEKTGITVSTA